MPTPSANTPEALEQARERETLLRLRSMGFNEDEADLILALRIPLERFISLVEIRRCPPHLALEILRP